jgi:ethanolamine permease
VVTLIYQLQQELFLKGVIWVILWCVIGIIYFALIGRNKLILSPEEEFAMEHTKK